MEVIAVCRSKKNKRSSAARVLDRYLFRIGDRTWRGRASMECLRRISVDLKKSASRNMAVAIYRTGASERDHRPVFIVGSRTPFDASGRCPVSTRKQKMESRAMPGADSLRAVVEAVILFHDVGKASVLFNDKLRETLKDGLPRADIVRHEAMSALVLAHLIDANADTADLVAARLEEVARNPSEIDRAWSLAAEKCREILKGGSDVGIFSTRDHLGDSRSLRAILILLVLSHHRLPDARHAEDIDADPFEEIKANVQFRVGEKLEPRALDIAEGVPFWHEDWFAKRLSKVAGGIRTAGEIGLPLDGLDVWARTPLMAADHIGSSEKRPGTIDGHLANLMEDPFNSNEDKSDRVGKGLPIAADSLSQHTRRVLSAGRSMVFGALRDGDRCPAIAEDMVPPSIRAPRLSGGRFDWQVHAAQVAADVSASAPGGFFGVLIAGTGSGKTRGAAGLICAASMHDADERRRGVRYNLALPLRSLATQSAQEYVDDLGFSSADVAAMVGGELPHWKEDTQKSEDDDNFEWSGSEDRIATPDDMAEVDEARSTGALLDEVAYPNLNFLWSDLDRRLPPHLDRFCEADRTGKAQAFLSKPILSATIDHFMPASSPLMGRHLMATWRVMTSDLVIDELDQLGDEDLSAVRRLVRVAGLAGRRVVVMSATMPSSLADSLYKTYCKAWGCYAKIASKADVVHHVVAGDAAGAVSSSLSNPCFSASLASCLLASQADMERRDVVQMAEILPRAANWGDQVKIISESMKQMHERHHVVISGCRVSVGVVRMTRVRHLQRLAVDLAAASPECHYAVLHAKLPRLRREKIERELKMALTRKGLCPNSGLETFIRSRVLDPLEQGGDLRIVVLATAVIETGNDLDFDWVITDPCSTRSIVQVSGRANRHRRQSISEPNIAILGDYLVARDSSARKDILGLIASPGAETPPNQECGVRRERINGIRSAAVVLQRQEAWVVDARLCEASTSVLAQAEAQVRERFQDRYEKDSKSVTFWLSRRCARHRFRRPTSQEVDAFPIVGSEGAWAFFSRRGVEPSAASVKNVAEGHFRGRNLFAETLDELLGDVHGATEGRLAKMCALKVPLNALEDIAKVQYLDPVLGLLSDEDEVPVVSLTELIG